jgi:tripartite-type tricarboxylate transporter receptor subunit TctC
LKDVTMKQKRLVVRLAAAALALLPLATAAQTYPSRVVRWIAPFPPGGGTDVISRAIAQKLTDAWGQQVIVDNRPGSGGTIGLAAAAKSPPDGYTIVLGQLANVGIAPGLYPKLSYDPVKDLQPVTVVIAAPLILVAHPSLPVKNVKELFALARAKPDSITFGSPGNGTTGHLAAELIKSTTGVKMVHVPYKGAAPAITGLLGGEIAIYMSTIPAAQAMLKSGRIKVLGITSAQREPALPDVPTVAESGLPGYEVTNWWGVMLPAGVQRDILARLHQDVVRILKLPEMQERLAGEGGSIVAGTPEQFAALVRSEVARWSKVIKASGARID